MTKQSTQNTLPSVSFPMSYDTWQAWRLSTVAGPAGNLAVVAMPPVRQLNQTFEGLAGAWSKLSTPESVTVSATAADQLLVGGQAVNGTVTIQPFDLITFSPTRTGRVVREVDGTYYLQVSDAAAPQLQTFEQIVTYPFDAAWAVPAEYRINPDANRIIEVNRATEAATHSRTVPVNVHFKWGGSEYVLAAYSTFSDQMFIVTFTDETTGHETPGAGRIMLLPRMPEGDFVFDFNQAMLLPHEFSAAFPCPLPPAENRLPFAVTAGEKGVMLKR
jgi:uncharacterized protein